MDRTCRKGFTLVELAVSMVVIGILLGLGMSMVGPLMTSMKVRESRENLGAAVESVNSYASGNNRLPDSTTSSGSSTLWKNVAKTYTDAWGREFIYLYDSNLAPATATKDSICGRRSTPITLRQCLTSNCSTTAGIDYIDVPNVAYIMFSLADDAASNSRLTGTLTYLTATGTLTSTALNNGIITVSGYITPTSPATTATVTADTVNDLVRWVTLDELRTKVGCQGPQLKIVNNELPYGYNQTTYNATIFADGGVPFSSGGNYRWCIQNTVGIAPANMTFKNSGSTIDIPFSTNCSILTEASWVQSDSIVIGGLPTVNITGSDSKVYTCTQNHTAAVGNMPVSGASWAVYWQPAPSGATGSTWTSGKYYTTLTQALTVFVRDNNDTSGSNDNAASKIFTLTINSQ